MYIFLKLKILNFLQKYYKLLKPLFKLLRFELCSSNFFNKIFSKFLLKKRTISKYSVKLYKNQCERRCACPRFSPESRSNSGVLPTEPPHSPVLVRSCPF